MKSDDTLLESFLGSHPHDAARTLERLPENMTAGLLASIEPALAAPILERMLPSLAAQNLQEMETDTAAAIVEYMATRESARLLRAMPVKRSELLLGRLDIKVRLQIAKQLKYAGHSVAAQMNPQVFTLPQDITVGDALKRIERHKGELDAEFYLVDAQYHLLGAVVTAALLNAGKTQMLSSLMNTQVPRLPAQASVNIVADMPVWLDYQRLPVVEKDGTLIGVLSSAELRQATGSDEYESMTRVTGMSALDLCWTLLSQLLQLILVRESAERKRR